jgi:molybdate transport system substrate-binding protein
MIRAAIAAIAVFLTAAMAPTTSNAAEIKLFAAGALRQMLSELLPQFEQDTGHRVSATYGTAGGVTDRLAKGEATDVAIVSDITTVRLSGGVRLNKCCKAIG